MDDGESLVDCSGKMVFLFQGCFDLASTLGHEFYCPTPGVLPIVGNPEDSQALIDLSDCIFRWILKLEMLMI